MSFGCFCSAGFIGGAAQGTCLRHSQIMSETPSPSFIANLNRGMLGKCPRCGRGRLFAGFLKVAQTCDSCGQSFSEHDAADGPAVFGIFVIGGVVVALALVLERLLSPPFWVHAIIWGPCIIAGSVAILRPIKGITIALQYRYRSTEDATNDRHW